MPYFRAFSSSVLPFLLLPALAAGALAACSASDGNSTDLSGAEPTSSSDAGSTNQTDAGGKTPGKEEPEEGCKPNPSCARHLCQCNDDSIMATDGLCLPDGGCGSVDLCELACGASGFSGGVWEQKRCSGTGQCSVTSQPTVECACSYGYGVNTYPRCTEGFCSAFEKDVCPVACQSQGGWTCKGAADCTPNICACKDGTTPVVAGACSGGSCSPNGAICPSACSDRGGWSGTASTTDGGTTTGPKAPGEPCTSGGECTPFDCTCNDGTSFAKLRSCQSKVCATKSQTCSNACLSSGGWSGP
jgi:hypothetical protein